MKRVLVAIGMLATVGIRPAWAQSAGDCVPSALNIPEAKYPCLYADHRALFRVAAPDAQKVRVRIGPGFDMTKGPDGIWTVTTTSLAVADAVDELRQGDSRVLPRESVRVPSPFL